MIDCGGEVKWPVKRQLNRLFPKISEPGCFVFRPEQRWPGNSLTDEREAVLLDGACIFQQASSLKLRKSPFNYRLTADLVGISTPVLRYYPKVRALVDLHTDKQQAAGGLPSLKEDELVTKVRKAITQLQSLGQSITKAAISKMVGVHVSALVTYSRVNALLKQVTSIYHEDRKRAEQALLSEEVLAAKVEKAVQQLECLGKPVTQRAVSAMIGVPASSLYYYPKVISLIQSVIRDKRLQSMVVQTQLREEELVIKVMGAIEDLRTSGRTVSVRAIVKEVQLSEGALKRYPRVKVILDQVVYEGGGKRKRSA